MYIFLEIRCGLLLAANYWAAEATGRNTSIHLYTLYVCRKAHITVNIIVSRAIQFNDRDQFVLLYTHIVLLSLDLALQFFNLY
jgi:hypothetical protein